MGMMFWNWRGNNLTNYERIKNMSVEEMAAIIMCPAEMDCCFETPKTCAKYSNAIEIDCDCCKCCEKYLESEVDRK